MKKNDWIVVAVTGIYSFLFYNEGLGLNLGLFTLVIIIGMIFNDINLLKQKKWVIIALSCCFSAITIGYNGSLLAIFSSMSSILILVGISMSKKTSIIFSFIYGIYSSISSPYFLGKKVSENRKSAIDQSKLKRRLLMILLPLIITLIFFFLYRNSNPIFESFSDQIDWDWISIDWILFTLIGLIAIFGIYNARKIEFLASKDEIESLDIVNKEENEFKIFGMTILVVDEYFSGKILFILLNVLLGIVNLLDFNFIFVDRSLPNDLTYSEFLHQSVGTLVISTIVAICIVLYYFRGQINFYQKSKTLKWFAYLWMIQNIFMLISVCLKNNMYINQYGLTYKRIGIYFFVILTVFGLITLLLKVYKVKINMYLIRINGWSFYSVLIFSAIINWDVLIVDFNQKCKKGCDMNYALSLSDSTIPSLVKLESISTIKNKNNYKKKLSIKIDHFNNKQKNKSWKSWNYQEAKVRIFLKNQKK